MQEREKNRFQNKSELHKISVELLTGGIAGGAAQYICYPIDTVKTVYQHEGIKSYTVLTKEIFKQGIINLWRGSIVPTLTFGVVNSVCFGSYYYITKKFDNNELTSSTIIAAAAFSGTLQLIPWVPSEVIKINMQQKANLPGYSNVTVMSTIKHIYKKNGIRGFYVGTLAQATRDIPNNIAYFYTYQHLSIYLHDQYNFSPITNAFISGGITGTVAWVIVIPSDFLKTRVQANSDKNLNELRSKLLSSELSICRGSLISTFRSFCLNALIFVFYEQIFPIIDKCDDRIN